VITPEEHAGVIVLGVGVRPRQIDCVASSDWPDLYQGVLDEIDLQPVGRDERELGTFHVPAGAGPITRAFLFIRYETTMAVARPGAKDRADRTTGGVASGNGHVPEGRLAMPVLDSSAAGSVSGANTLLGRPDS
jgi:hypothetical protein